MPELPEVETTRRGIAPYLQGQAVRQLVVRNPSLRWPVPPDLGRQIQHQTVRDIRRRAKYLLVDFDRGTLLIHLGMSGSLRITEAGSPPLRHDHIDLVLDNGVCLRYCDPRRFGCWLWSAPRGHDHPLLQGLGPEPLESGFTATYLLKACRARSQPIKTAIMDPKLVTGVGNIYANEALFMSRIRPDRPAHSLTPAETRLLRNEIRAVLRKAVRQGGTTLRDYVNGQGKPGYFAQQLQVYGHGGQPCPLCGATLVETRLGQRSTVYCPECQS